MMPTVTKNLIIINVLVFFGTFVAQRYGIDLTNYLGLHFFLAILAAVCYSEYTDKEFQVYNHS